MEKAEPHPLDYKELTFKDFIIIQEKAQEVANNIGYNVYLVGSALVKHTPRDIDLVIIIPYEKYVSNYKKGVYEIKDLENSFGAILGNAWYKEFENIKPLEMLKFKDYKIDLKICPDTWWVEKEKIILAKPKIKD